MPDSGRAVCSAFSAGASSANSNLAACANAAPSAPAIHTHFAERDVTVHDLAMYIASELNPNLSMRHVLMQHTTAHPGRGACASDTQLLPGGIQHNIHVAPSYFS